MIADYPSGPVLLDTEAFLWAAIEPEHLSTLARAVCESPQYTLMISPATLAEILIKPGTGKLPPDVTPKWFYRQAENLRAIHVRIGAREVETSFRLPQIHRDPFDRLIIATALEQPRPLLTCDETIRQYPAVLHVR